MRKLIPLFALLTACSQSGDSKQASNDGASAPADPPQVDAVAPPPAGAAPVASADRECVFQFSEHPTCTYAAGASSIQLTLAASRIADNEIELTRAEVSIDGKQHELQLSADTSMIEGTAGSVLFDDIDFDGTADLAISTSFGTANQYLDYWIYDPAARQYIAVGNFPRLKPDPAAKTLEADVRVNAATHETQMYVVVGHKLELKQ